MSAHEFDFSDEGAWDELWSAVVAGPHPRLRRNDKPQVEDLGNRVMAAEVITAQFVVPRNADSLLYIQDARFADRMAEKLEIPRGTIVVVPGRAPGIAVKLARRKDA
ncbi:hypothetical protein [Microbacterium enclense]|uniref:hypothetical protein n=1 Tax=Microbacterium enclense TaxID=993073 RepID=UPI003F800CBA